jgi:hypothetical protein
LNPIAIIVVALETQNDDDDHLRSKQKKLWDVSAPGLEKWLHVTQVLVKMLQIE